MEKGNLLVVEDDLNLGILLMQLLQEEGYRVRLAKDGIQGLEMIKKEQYDLCIFDVMLPRIDGFNLAHHLKDHQSATPYIFLTARVLKEDKLKGYDLGAEDYITKPFDEEELLCKINVILRRKNTDAQNEQDVYEIGKYTFDVSRMELSYGDEKTRLTEKESLVLRELCLHKNRILNREEAVARIYGKYDYFNGRSFDVFISKVRKLLCKDENINIENVYKVGFILNVSSSINA